MKGKKYLSFLALGLLISCSGGGDDSPPTPPVPDPPSAATLVFPFENSECTTGVDLNTDFSEVTFEWNASENTDVYTLEVINLNSSTPPQTLFTSETTATLAIAKGTPFSWSVTSRNNESQEAAESESWLFYNAGVIINYPPFPATIVAPESGSTAVKNQNDEILFDWNGADVEDDIVSYELFFATGAPDVLTSVYVGEESSFAISGLASASVNYWKVITTDAQGNTSDSGVYDFKVQ